MTIQKGAALAAGFVTLAVGIALPMYAANKQSPMATACDKASAARAEARQMAAEGRLLRAEGRLYRTSTLCAREQTGIWVDRAELLSQLGHCKDASGVASLARAERDLDGADRARLDAARARCDEHERPRTDEDRAAAAKARTAARGAELEGRFDEAATLWGEAWDRSHTDPEDLVGQGRCADWAGHRVEATRAYQRALAASWRAKHGVPTTTAPWSSSLSVAVALTAGHVFLATEQYVEAVSLASARVTPLAGDGAGRVLAADGSAWLEQTGERLRYVDARSGTTVWEGTHVPDIVALARARVAWVENGQVHAVEVPSGRELFAGPADETHALELSEDGGTLLLQDARRVTVRDLATGTVRFSAPCEGTASLSADGALMAYKTPGEAQGDGPELYEVRVVDVRTGARLHGTKGHFGRVGRVALSRDGRYVATISPTSVRVRDLVSDEEVWRNEATPQAVAWSADGRKLAVVTWDGLHLVDPATRAVEKDPRGTPLQPHTVAISRDGSRLAVIVDEKVRVFALPSLASLSTFEAKANVYDERLALSPDGRLVAVTAPDVPPHVHDAQTGARIAEVHPPDAGEWLDARTAFADDGTLTIAVTKGPSGAVSVLHVDPQTGVIRSTTSPAGAENGVSALSKDGRFAVVGRTPLRIVSLDGARPPVEISSDIDAVHASATSARVWTADNRTVRLFDALLGTKIAEGTAIEKGWTVADAAGSLRGAEWPPLAGDLFTRGDFDEGGGYVARVVDGHVLLQRRGVEDELVLVFSSLGGLSAKSPKGLGPVFRSGPGAVPYRCHLADEQTIAWDACASELSLSDPSAVLGTAVLHR